MEIGIQINLVALGNWHGNWTWSLPLIVLNVVVHVFGLVFINETVVPLLSGAMERLRFGVMFAAVMGVTALFATVLHAFEAGVWAAAYRLLGALPDNKSAMLIRSAPSPAMATQTCFWSVTGNCSELWRP